MVYDITRKETFEHCEEWIRKLRDVEPNCKILLVGNKADLEEFRQVENTDGNNVANC